MQPATLIIPPTWWGRTGLTHSSVPACEGRLGGTMKRPLSAILATCLVLLIAHAHSATRPTITVAQAQGLVLKALTAEQKRLPGLGAQQYQDPNSSRFFFFTVTWAAGPGQSVVVGNYAVDPYTGDVWSAVVGCEELRNRALQVLQGRVRQSLGLSEAQYRRLKTKGPLCEE